ncbi:hypothetical protein BDV95DRAFT_346794 [Massariosphaeria phaeospora]|uniref:Uncharacterized protein n=1 Tax=Massariosphaeria phaeospora TaxID=100035 RepID=A0A7C8MNI5_9PLEO|nr:hypothetical protein BDV95DRAFT_346794 [Massariosphaeria phaeospora]
MPSVSCLLSLASAVLLRRGRMAVSARTRSAGSSAPDALQLLYNTLPSCHFLTARRSEPDPLMQAVFPLLPTSFHFLPPRPDPSLDDTSLHSTFDCPVLYRNPHTTIHNSAACRLPCARALRIPLPLLVSPAALVLDSIQLPHLHNAGSRSWQQAVKPKTSTQSASALSALVLPSSFPVFQPERIYRLRPVRVLPVVLDGLGSAASAFPNRHHIVGCFSLFGFQSSEAL